MARSARHRSAVTNGSRVFLSGTPLATEAARRFRDILEALEAERAPDMPFTAREACRVYAGLSVRLEQLHADMAGGATVDPEALGQLGDRMARQVVRMGPVKAPPVRQSLRDLHDARRGQGR